MIVFVPIHVERLDVVLCLGCGALVSDGRKTEHEGFHLSAESSNQSAPAWSWEDIKRYVVEQGYNQK